MGAFQVSQLVFFFTKTSHSFSKVPICGQLSGQLESLTYWFQALLLEGWPAGFFNFLTFMVEETCVSNPVPPTVLVR